MSGWKKYSKPLNQGTASALKVLLTKRGETLTANEQTLKVVLATPSATLPTKGGTYSCGYNIYCSKDVTIPQKGKQWVETDVKIKVPEGTYGRLILKPNIAETHHLSSSAGVVDEDYTGPIKILVFNHGNRDYHVKAQNEIALLICECISHPIVEEVDSIEESIRGAFKRLLYTPSKEERKEPITASDKEVILKVVRTTPNAVLPTKGSDFAAGFDICCAEDTIIPQKGKGWVETDIKVDLPKGTYGRLALRSGVSERFHLSIEAGIVNESPIRILIFNHGNLDYHIKTGDRVAQLICEKLLRPKIQEVQSLEDTSRGTAGFGSTGL